MEKGEIIKLKSEPSVVNYIQLLQANISRMSSHSGIIKASICVVYTILITILIAISKINDFWWIAIVITLIGSIIDAYYLAMEKIYVKKYNDFINKCNIDETEIYDMKPKNTDLKNELLAMVITSMTSFSIYGFYSLFIIISILLKFV